MEELRKYDQQTQEIIVKFGLQFLHCMTSFQQQEFIDQTSNSTAISNNKELQDIRKETERLGSILRDLRIEQLEKSNMLVEKLDKVLCTSVGLGEQGEYIVEKALMQQYPLAVITNTSKQANAGDLMMIIEGKRILIEVKNYSNTIPTSQVDKFMNDVNNSQCDCGLFIAFDQRIANKPRIAFELSQTGKQVVFMSQQEGTDSLLVIVELMCQFLQQQHLNVDKLQKQQDIARLAIQQSIASIKKQHIQTNSQLKQLKSIWDNLITIEESMTLLH